MWQPENWAVNTWSSGTARKVIPLLVSLAEAGGTITYGELDKLIVKRKWGHHVHAAAYAGACGSVGSALFELGNRLKIDIPR